MQTSSYLLQPPPLLLLLLDAFLPLGQQLALVLLVLLLLQLLTPDQLRPLLVGQLEAQEVPPQSGLPGNVDDGAGGEQFPGVRGHGLSFKRRVSEAVLLPGLANIPLLVLLLTPAVLVLRLICRKHTDFRLTSTASRAFVQVFAGVR